MADPIYDIRTPNGIQIAFFMEPKRHYVVNGEEAISVTEALKILNKDALVWWGQRVGAQALDTLLSMRLIHVATDGERIGFAPSQDTEVKIDGELVTLLANVLLDIDVQHGIDQFTPIFSKFKLSTNHIVEEASDRGQSVHDAFERWGVTGELPDPGEYDWVEKPYVQGLRSFLIDALAGGLAPEMQEVAVASPKHKYAGRFDFLGNTKQPMRVVTKTYPKNPPKHVTVPPGRGLIDLKTSKDIYDTHLLQLAAYENGLEECGYGTVDWCAVLQVGKDGRYQFRRASATIEDYVAVLDVYRRMKVVKEGMKV